MLSNPISEAPGRVHVILLGVAGTLIFLTAALWHLQVVEGGEYRETGLRQSIRGIRLPSVRGRILDRNGVRLAGSRPSYCIAVYIEELRQPGGWSNTIDRVERTITEVEDVINLTSPLTREGIAAHVKRRLPLPLTAFRDIGEKGLARWSELGGDRPGVGIQVEALRIYPHGKLAGHLLGYVGRSKPAQNPDDPYHYYLPQMGGRRGIEAVKNRKLTGKAGGRLVQVDASGFVRRVFRRRDPVPGEDVMLTIDADIQRLAEEALAFQPEWESGSVKGAIVAMDPRNGDVLAMAGAPSFDPNVFSPSVSPEQWEALMQDEGKPLLNRPVAAVYAPGSTFKPVVAIAALENGKADAGTKFDCPGYFRVGNATFNCWSTRGHGTIGMRKALEQSCNAFFCQLGLQCGYEYIYHMASALGFGKRTGIALVSEQPGLLPDEGWKRRRYRDAWRPGDTCNASIGQGALCVTPLQMCVMVSVLANGGYVYRPRLIHSGVRAGNLVNAMEWSADTLELVRGGMRDVIQAPHGTGKRAKVDGVEMAGKTGTAEYGVPEENKKHAWMIAFAPFGNPRYAVSVVIEDALSGGRNAAPRIQHLMEGIFALERYRTDHVKVE
ncbi:MAG: penicillin-binding protein 2 [Kiritimatiellia bacterium]